MKTCSLCKVKMNISLFNKNRANAGGLNYWCRECANRKTRDYRRTVSGHEATVRGQRTYRETEKGKEARRARHAVSIAVRSGKIPKASDLLCETCSEPAVHYHHNSYAPENHLDVVPLCMTCHKRED